MSSVFDKPPGTREDHEGQTANARMEINTGGVARQITQNGVTRTEDIQKVTTVHTRDVDYKSVTVNGFTVEREQYLRLKAEGAIPPDAKIDDPLLRLQRERGGEVASPFSPSETHDLASDTPEDKPKAETAEDLVFRDGQSALDYARKTIGADTVTSLIGEAVESGDVEKITTALTDGKVSSSQVARVVAAYAASAGEMVAATGLAVDDLSLALDDSDLRDARAAVVQGDAGRMSALARKAQDNLASMPAKSPAAFAAYIEARFPGLDYEIKGGRAIIDVEGHGEMPFDALVRLGVLRTAKVVLHEDHKQ